MSDNREAAEAALGDSTVLDAGQQTENPLSDAAFQAPEPEALKEEKAEKVDKPLSTRDAIENSLKEAEAKEKAEAEAKAKPEAPAKVEVKGEKPAEELPAKSEKGAAPEKDDAETGQEGDKKARQSEGRPFYEPPARFLPKAKEAWANVPNVVKSEIDRIAREHETEVTQYRESHENWQKVAKFDEMAKQHNTSVPDALERYTAVDALLHNNPLEGIRQVLQTIGITPQQYAEYITKNPQAAQAPRQQPQPDPVQQRTSQEVETLRAEIQNMKAEQVARSVIEPFVQQNPRYHELEEDIAFFLNSGKIPTTLSPQERLAAAYDMAARINPRSVSEPETVARGAPEPTEPVVDPRGTKSIKGAPSAGFDPTKKRFKSNRDAATAALQELGI